MPRYGYALHRDSGPEHLGFIEIPCDSEAIAFGREVIIDIMQEPDPAFGPVSLEITDGRRQVDSVSLQLAERRKGYS